MSILNQFFVILSILIAVYGDKQNVTIAGVFNIYDDYGNVDYIQLEHLSAFVLAINDINSRSDILTDVHLNYIIKSSQGIDNSALTALELSNHPDEIPAIVSALSYQELSVMSPILAADKVLLASTVASDAEFSNGDDFPYVIHTNPLTPQSAHLQQVTFCELGIQGIVVFASTDLAHVYYSYEATNNDVCKLIIRAKYMFDPDTTDFSIIINNALNIQSTAMLIYTTPKCAALLLEQGYNAGLFRKGVMIFVGQDISNADMIPYFSSTTDVGSILYGALGQKFWPNYYILTQSTAAVTFMKKWVNQNSTSLACDSIMDSYGNYYLYQNSSKVGSCVGLNFSSYSLSGANLNEYTAYTYDATYLLAYGIEVLAKSNKLITGENLRFAAIHNVSFTGPTGPVSLQKGKPEVNNYGMGSRGGAIAYRVLNFIKANYYANSSLGFGDCLNILANGAFLGCNNKFQNCVTIYFNTLHGGFANGYPPYAFNNLPTYVKIGALFAPLDANGYPNNLQAEMLAAFAMAIKEINNKKDGIYDNVLPSTTILFDLEMANGYSEALTSSQSLIGAFYYSGVNGVVSGLPDMESLATHKVLSSDGNQIFQIDSFASDDTLTDGSTYIYKAQVVPVESYEIAAIHELICNYFGYRKVAFISSNSIAGQALLNEIVVYGDYCVLDQLSNIIIPQSQTGFTSTVRDIKSSGAKVVILLVSGSTAASILELGYTNGLFGEGFQVFTTSSTATSMISSFSVNADVEAIMKGVIYSEFWSEYPLLTESGKTFVSRWRQQTYRGHSLSNGILQCDKTLDDAGNTYLYQSQNGSMCTGLNFSSYSLDGSNISPYALYTYDATYALALGLDQLIKSGLSVNGGNLRTFMLNQVNFTGVTGYINFEQSDISKLYYTRGDRELGIQYKIMNFNYDAYKSNSSISFVQVLQWSRLNGIQNCSSICSDIIYNSKDNRPVAESKPTIIKTMPLSGVIILSLLFALIVIMVVIFTGLVVKYYKSKLVKAAQPEMLICILLGVLLAGGRVLIAGLPITDVSCISGLWLAHIAFVLAFGALFIKTYRVHVVLNSKNFKRVVFTGGKALKYMTVALILFIVLMVILTVVGRPHRSYISSTTSNQTTKTVRCAFHRPQVHTALFILEAVIIFVGARLCLAVKDVPDAVNESKYIAVAITFILMISVLVFPIVFLLGLEPNVYQIIASLSFGVAAIVTVNTIFLPKAISILSDKTSLKVHLKHAKKHKVVVPVASDADEGAIGLNQSINGVMGISHNNSGVVNNTYVTPDNLFDISKGILSKMKPDERVRFCYENISKWQAMLLNPNSTASQGSSHASSIIDNPKDMEPPTKA